VLDFFKSFSGIRASPPVLLDAGDDGPDGPPAVLDGVCSPYTVIFLSCSYLFPLHNRIHFFDQNQLPRTTIPILTSLL